MMLDIDVNTPVGSQATIDTVATLKDAVRLVLGSLGTDDRVSKPVVQVCVVLC